MAVNPVLGPVGTEGLTGLGGVQGMGGLLGLLIPFLLHHAATQGQPSGQQQTQPVAQRQPQQQPQQPQSPSAQGPQGITQGRHGAQGPQAAANSPAGRRAAMASTVPGQPAPMRGQPQQTPSLGGLAGPRPFDQNHPAIARIGALLAARRGMNQQPGTMPAQGNPNGGAPSTASGPPPVDLLAALNSSPFMRSGMGGSPQAQGRGMV